jgi:hypothetical protein
MDNETISTPYKNPNTLLHVLKSMSKDIQAIEVKKSILSRDWFQPWAASAKLGFWPTHVPM